MARENMRHPLRKEAERLLGENIRISRNTALYYAPREAGIPECAWFVIGQADASLELAPTEAALRAFEDWAKAQLRPEGLGEELLRLDSEIVTKPELDLFILGVKQFELHAAPMAWLMYDKRLRQLSADCLRDGRGGGGLYACWTCMALSNQPPAKQSSEIKGGTE